MRYPRKWQLAFVCLVAASLLPLLPARRGHAQAGVNYTVTDLGTLGGEQSRAYGIDECGRVVGESFPADSSSNHPFIWSNGQMTDMGTFGGNGGTASALNGAGVAVGDASLMSGDTHAFIWTNDAGKTDIGVIPGGTFAAAYDVNASKQIVGVSEIPPINALSSRGFIWQQSTGMQALPTLGGGSSAAYGINSGGDIVGTADTSKGGSHAYIIPSGGSITDLGTLGGGVTSIAYKINDGGTVVGYSKLPSNTATLPFHAFTWSSATGMLDIGTLAGGSRSIAYDINNSGQVVGWSEVSSGASHAFIYTSAGGMLDLNDLSPGSNWTLTEARAINDRGQIVGIGINPSGKTHAFLLTPDNIAPVSTSVSGVSGTGVYNGTATLTATLLSACGFPVSGKEISFTINGSSAGTATTDAGGVATLSNATLTGVNVGTHPGAVGASFAGDAGFGAASSTGTLTVSKADQTITFAPLADKTFGNPDFALSASASSGLALSFMAVGQCTVAGNTVHLTGAGACTITASQGGDSNFNAAPDAGRSFTINKAAQTITFAQPTDKTFGDPDFTLSASASSGLGVSFSVSGNCTNSGSTIHITGAGSCTVTASQAGNVDYNAATPLARSFNINKANQTVTFGTLAAKTFGDADFSVSASASSGLGVSFSATGNCTASGSSVHITGAGACTVTASQGGDSNFKPAPDVQQSFNINKAGSTTKVSVANATFDGQPHGASASVTGAGGLNQSVTPITYTGRNATIYNSTTPPNNAGDYTASATFGGDSNHTTSSDSKDFQIAKAGQTITVNTHAPSAAAFNSSFTVAATSSSGLIVAFSSSGDCTRSGATFTMTKGTGSCTVKYDQAGDANHNPATQVSEVVTAQKASQTIAFASLTDKTFGDPDFTLSASASSGLSVSFSASGKCSVAGNTVHLTGGGACTITASQGGDSNFNAAPDVSRSFTVNKTSQTITFAPLADKTFGDPDFTLSASASSGLGVSFSVSGQCSVSGATVHITGAGSCIVTASQSGDANFSVATAVSQTFQIAKAASTTAVSTSASSAPSRQSVTFTANVTSVAGTPTGSVQFKADGDNLGSSVNCVAGAGNSCSAQLSTSALAAGAHTITADYSGDSNFNASTGSLSGSQVVGGLFEFAQSLYTVGERDGSISIKVRRTGDTSQTATVDYATDDGSSPSVTVPCSSVTGIALERCDFTRAVGTLSFAPGETEKTFNVLVNDDSYTEGAETLSLRLSNPGSGSSLGAQSSAALQIQDDAPESSGDPIDDSSFFVRQHYHDFLGREPDASGLAFWTNEIDSCGADSQCRDVKRVNVSAAFFLSIEFQNTGYLVERMYKVAYGDAAGVTRISGSPAQIPVPVIRRSEFIADSTLIRNGLVVGAQGWEQLLENNKNAFALAFVQRQRFTNAYPTSMTPAQFVARLNQNTGGSLTQAEADALASEFGGAAETSDPSKRADVFRKVAENAEFDKRETNRAFVLMQFFGYLQRDPDAAPDTDHTGWQFWLDKLNQFNGDFIRAEMVKAFISADEYRHRFGQ